MRHVRNALRIVAFARVPHGEIPTAWGRVLVLVALMVVTPTAYTLLMLDGPGTWNMEGVSGVITLSALMVFAAAAAAAILRQDTIMNEVLQAALLAWLAVDLVTYLAWGAAGTWIGQQLPPQLTSAFYILPLLWLMLAITRFTATRTEASRGRIVMAGMAIAAILALPTWSGMPDRSVWGKDWTQAAARESGVQGDRWAAAREDSLYRQPQLLAAALDDVAPGRPGVVDVFFIGLAGYGPEDVFMREVNAVATLMRERFGAEGHVVKLVNNAATVNSTPVASLTSLKAALRRVAERMDRDEDVLVLFMTSHGSANHHFSVSLPPLRLDDIEPAALRAALDESGIRNRVVVISACYAGGFVEPLKDERTVVIAAAAPDRNSFGCGNESEWTYFGRAYFDEALRKTHSFVEAFDIAQPVIAAREAEAKFEPSRPMIHAGALARERLALLARQLDQAP